MTGGAPSRRQLLWWLLAVCSSSSALPVAAVVPSPPTAVQRWLLRERRWSPGLVALGEAIPPSQRRGAEARLLARLGGPARDGGYPEALRRTVASDLARGRLASVAGWRLAEAEALFVAALAEAR